MNVRNNSLHYKMYKSKKNIVYAGLVTTAALAGLTLSNVNNTVSADTTSAANSSALTTSATNSSATNSSATSEQISAASANVVATSNALSDANKAVASAQTNYNNAAQLNSGVTAITSAEAVVKSYDPQISDARVELGNLVTNMNSASAVESAAVSNPVRNVAASSAIAQGNYVDGLIATASAKYPNSVTYGSDAYSETGSLSSGNPFIHDINKYSDIMPENGSAANLDAWEAVASTASSAVARDQAAITEAENAYKKLNAQSASLKVARDTAVKNSEAVSANPHATSEQKSQATSSVNALLDAVDANQRALVAWSGYAGYTWEQTANQLGTAQGTMVPGNLRLIAMGDQTILTQATKVVNAIKAINEAKAKVAEIQAQQNVVGQKLADLFAGQENAKATVTQLRNQYNLLDQEGLNALQGRLDALNNVITAANGELNTEYTFVTPEGGTPTSGSASYNQLSQGIVQDEQAVAKAQERVNSASAALTSASTALDSAQAALKATDLNDTVAYNLAQSNVAAAAAAKTKAEKDLEDANSGAVLRNPDGTLDTTNTGLKGAQSVLQADKDALTKFVADHNLNIALRNLEQAQSETKLLQQRYQEALANNAAAKDAVAALNTASVALDAAKANLAKAQKAYDDAVAYYNSLVNGETPAQKSDAEKYGANIIVGGTTIYQIPTKKANSTKMALAAATADEVFAAKAVEAVVPAPSAEQVMGGKADAVAAVKSVAWADPAKVNEDATKPGKHVEEIIVTFKDGSTKTASWNLTVLPAKDDNTDTPVTPDNPGSDSQAPSDTPATSDQPAQSGSTVNPDTNVNSGATNNGVDSNGTVANGSHAAANTVNFGNGNAAVLPAATSHVAANTVAANKSDAASLPQTGNKDNSAIVALGAVSAMFGLGLAAKKREF